jgi:hypothetical protein
MEECVFEGNIEALGRSYPAIQEAFRKFQNRPSLEILNTKSGDYTCKLKKGGREFLIHSQFDPKREAERTLKAVNLEKDRIIILLGFGLGYLLDLLLEKVDLDRKIVAIEKRAELFHTSLFFKDWRKIFNDQRVRLIVGRDVEAAIEELDELTRDLPWEEIGILEHKPSIRLSPEYYGKIKVLIEKKGAKSKVKVVWIPAYSELDYDVKLAFDQIREIDAWFVDLGSGGYRFPPPSFRDFPPGIALEEVIEEVRPDLIIHRCGWQYEPYQVKKICDAMRVKHLLWAAEVGPNREWQLNKARGCDRVFVVNVPDVELYKKNGFKMVDHMPFCCSPSFHKRVEPDGSYRCDAVVYGAYTHKGKIQSVIELVVPLLNNGYKVDIYGIRWPASLNRFYKGLFPYTDLPKVNAGARFVLSITANYDYERHYTSRMIRAMGCGSFVITRYTKGMEKDGFRNQENLCWVHNQNDTLEVVRRYMEDEEGYERIRQNAQKFAYENYNYERHLRRMVERGLE